MNTVILSVPYKRMRYATYGDYLHLADDSVEITVIELADWRHEFLIALHEFIEEAVTRHRPHDRLHLLGALPDPRRKPV